jgi:hypothetical protein
MSALSGPERRALVAAIARGADDADVVGALRDLLDAPAFEALGAEERAAVARQVAAHPSAETARRFVMLVNDPAFQALPRDLSLHEIGAVATAEPPSAEELARGAGLEPPPRSRPAFWTMAVEGGLELAEIAEAGHLLDGIRAGAGPLSGAAVLEGAAAVVVPLIAAFECAEGIHASIEDGREWGRRVAYGAGFAEGIARRLAGSTSDAVPAPLRGEAAVMFRSGLRAADTALVELSPSDRAALFATGGGAVTNEMRALVARRTIHGR